MNDLVPLMEAARRLGIPYKTCFYRMKTGRFLAIRAGGVWLVSVSDVAAGCRTRRAYKTRQTKKG